MEENSQEALITNFYDGDFTMKKTYFLLAIALFVCRFCSANMMPFNDATTWTAGTSGLNAFYGSGYSTGNGYAELTVSDNDMVAGRRAIVWATSIPDAGTYTYSLDSKYNNYYTQYNHWMVYLLNSGSQFNLVGGPTSGYIQKVVAPVADADGQWHSYADSFSITAQQAADYDYIAFVMVGSKNSEQVLAYDNFTTNVPEPCTVLILGLGSGFLIRMRKKRGI